jgi:hypothetical protein
MVVAAEVAVDHRACRITAHSSRANDVSGAFGDVAMLDFRGAEAGEDLRMSIASRGEARLNIGADSLAASSAPEMPDPTMITSASMSAMAMRLVSCEAHPPSSRSGPRKSRVVW